MKTGMTLMNAGVAAQEALTILARAIERAEDLTPEQAHMVVRYATSLHCQAFELEREAMNIKPPKRG
jgi:hypothetical protein